jgi:hypothetical protein
MSGSARCTILAAFTPVRRQEALGFREKNVAAHRYQGTRLPAAPEEPRVSPPLAVVRLALVTEESVERTSFRSQADLGRLLAAAEGYRVLRDNGDQVGWLDRIRYERHAHCPDEIVVRSRGFFGRRRRVLPFLSVDRVSANERTVVLRSADAINPT